MCWSVPSGGQDGQKCQQTHHSVCGYGCYLVNLQPHLTEMISKRIVMVNKRQTRNSQLQDLSERNLFGILLKKQQWQDVIFHQEVVII